jgi:hypothetical protein
VTTEEIQACQRVRCDRCGAEQGESCPGGEPCGVRRLLAIEHGHFDPDTGTWVTRGRQLSEARS